MQIEGKDRTKKRNMTERKLGLNKDVIDCIPYRWGVIYTTMIIYKAIRHPIPSIST